jgi:hypothetical protein
VGGFTTQELGGFGRKLDGVVCPIGDRRGCFLLVKGRGGFAACRPRKGWYPMGTAAQAQAGRDRARESRLNAVRERRLRLDPDQLAREERIDEAAVDVEVAWEERTVAEHAVTEAEVAAAAAIERLLEERLAVKDVVQLTGLDQPTVQPVASARGRDQRRPRRLC